MIFPHFHLSVMHMTKNVDITEHDQEPEDVEKGTDDGWKLLFDKEAGLKLHEEDAFS